MAKESSVWECEACGFTQKKWTGSCLSCSAWNTFHEIKQFIEKNKKFDAKTSNSSCVKLKDIKTGDFERIKTNFSEFDRLVGGGIIKGALMLIGGSPGIGKS